MNEFIEINGRILDFEVYKEELHYLKEDVYEEMKEVLKRYGFCLKESINESYSNCSFHFYNNQLDVEIKIAIQKKEMEKFLE